MIYLLQDCYKDDKGEYHDVLKIGFSKDSFSRNRQGQYNTHNFGYKFLGEREGSCELENYLHKLLKKYNLSLEWFRYSQEVIDKFWKVKEEDISDFSSQDELNEYIRSYILNHLVPSVNKLKKLYLNQILHEISEKDIGYEEYKETYKRTIIEVFELVSTKEYKYFSDLNFNSSENIEILKKCNLTLLQIVGRQRNRENPFKNNIIIFYRTIRKTEMELYDLFLEKQNDRKSATDILLSEFDKMSIEGKQKYIQKLKSDIEVSKYENDYVSISKKTGEPVYNSFIEISQERAWEVSQKDYQDKISVTKSLESLTSNISEYRSKFEKEIDDFLLYDFSTVNTFEKKMKIYCEFIDYMKGSKEVMDIVYYRTKDPRFQKYYNFYGTKGCKAKEFREKNLEQGMIDTSKSDELSSAIHNKFKVGEKYLKKDIKPILQDIYRDLGITTSKPKTTDLGKYFNLTRIRIKQQEGYLLTEL